MLLDLGGDAALYADFKAGGQVLRNAIAVYTLLLGRGGDKTDRIRARLDAARAVVQHLEKVGEITVALSSGPERSELKIHISCGDGL